VQQEETCSNRSRYSSCLCRNTQSTEGQSVQKGHGKNCLVRQSNTLLALLSTKLEVLATLDDLLVPETAGSALETKDNLLRGFGLSNKQNEHTDTKIRFIKRGNPKQKSKKKCERAKYLLVEDGLGLTTETLLLAIVTTLT
jgi:hypothetical protein